MKKLTFLGLLFVLFGLLLVGCSSGSGDPGAVVERYLTALVEGDLATAASSSCAAWEQNVEAEGAAFDGVEAVLEGMECTAIEEGETTATVSCEGNVVFTYAGGEEQLLPLSRRNYSLVFEAGGWLMCGYE